MVPGQMSNFVGCNLLADMELAASESDADTYESEEEMVNLPEGLVAEFKRDRKEDEEMTVVSGGLSAETTGAELPAD